MHSHFSPQTLEAEFHQLIRRHQPQKQGIRQAWGKALLDFFTGQQALSIRQQQINGIVQWIVYDPSTEHRLVFKSEQAVRAWLEERHH